jgi:hypothetical protein
MLYHGVLAPNARWRARVVADGAPARRDCAAWESERGRCRRRAADALPLIVAKLMHRAFELDVLACPRCGGRMRLLATVEGPREIQELLSALALSASPMDRARAAQQIGRRKPYGRRLRLIATVPSGRLGRGLFEWPSAGRHRRELPLLSAAT